MPETLIKQINKSNQISNYVLSVKSESLPKEVVHEVKRRILDSFACAVGAFNSKAAKIVLKACSKVKGKYKAPLFGKKKKYFMKKLLLQMVHL